MRPLQSTAGTLVPGQHSSPARQAGARVTVARRAAPAALLVLVLGVSGARAASEFRVHLSPVTSMNLVNIRSDSPAAAVHDYAAPWNLHASSYRGFAAVGRLGASTTAQVGGSTTESGINSHGGASTVHFRLDDLLFVNLEDPGDTRPIRVSMNFALDGFFSFAGTESDHGVQNLAAIRVRDYSAYGVLKETGYYGIYADPALGALATGVFSGLSRTEAFEGVFSTPGRLFDVGVPQVYGLELTTTASVNTSLAEFRMASAEFMHTLAFQPGLPVFNLPEGYTVNSADGRIVNNRFVPTPIPEPEWLGMAVGVLLGFAGLRRARTAG